MDIEALRNKEEQIKELLKEHFETEIVSSIGLSSYLIFRDGTLVGAYRHRDMMDYLYEKGVLTDEEIDEYDTTIFNEVFSCVRCSDYTNDENYIGITDEALTEAQYNVLKDWIDNNVEINRKGVQVTAHFASDNQSSVYYDYANIIKEGDWPSDYIIFKIKKYYSSGKLEEDIKPNEAGYPCIHIVTEDSEIYQLSLEACTYMLENKEQFFSEEECKLLDGITAHPYMYYQVHTSGCPEEDGRLIINFDVDINPCPQKVIDFIKENAVEYKDWYKTNEDLKPEPAIISNNTVWHIVAGKYENSRLCMDVYFIPDKLKANLWDIYVEQAVKERYGNKFDNTNLLNMRWIYLGSNSFMVENRLQIIFGKGSSYGPLDIPDDDEKIIEDTILSYGNIVDVDDEYWKDVLDNQIKGNPVYELILYEDLEPIMDTSNQVLTGGRNSEERITIDVSNMTDFKEYVAQELDLRHKLFSPLHKYDDVMDDTEHYKWLYYTYPGQINNNYGFLNIRYYAGDDNGWINVLGSNTFGFNPSQEWRNEIIRRTPEFAGMLHEELRKSNIQELITILEKKGVDISSFFNIAESSSHLKTATDEQKKAYEEARKELSNIQTKCAVVGFYKGEPDPGSYIVWGISLEEAKSLSCRLLQEDMIHTQISKKTDTLVAIRYRNAQDHNFEGFDAEPESGNLVLIADSPTGDFIERGCSGWPKEKFYFSYNLYKEYDSPTDVDKFRELSLNEDIKLNQNTAPNMLGFIVTPVDDSQIIEELHGPTNLYIIPDGTLGKVLPDDEPEWNTPETDEVLDYADANCVQMWGSTDTFATDMNMIFIHFPTADLTDAQKATLRRIKPVLEQVRDECDFSIYSPNRNNNNFRYAEFTLSSVDEDLNLETPADIDYNHDYLLYFGYSDKAQEYIESIINAYAYDERWYLELLDSNTETQQSGLFAEFPDSHMNGKMTFDEAYQAFVNYDLGDTTDNLRLVYADPEDPNDPIDVLGKEAENIYEDIKPNEIPAESWEKYLYFDSMLDRDDTTINNAGEVAQELIDKFRDDYCWFIKKYDGEDWTEDYDTYKFDEALKIFMETDLEPGDMIDIAFTASNLADYTADRLDLESWPGHTAYECDWVSVLSRDHMFNEVQEDLQPKERALPDFDKNYGYGREEEEIEEFIYEHFEDKCWSVRVLTDDDGPFYEKYLLEDTDFFEAYDLFENTNTVTDDGFAGRPLSICVDYRPNNDRHRYSSDGNNEYGLLVRTISGVTEDLNLIPREIASTLPRGWNELNLKQVKWLIKFLKDKRSKKYYYTQQYGSMTWSVYRYDYYEAAGEDIENCLPEIEAGNIKVCVDTNAHGYAVGRADGSPLHEVMLYKLKGDGTYKRWFPYHNIVVPESLIPGYLDEDLDLQSRKVDIDKYLYKPEAREYIDEFSREPRWVVMGIEAPEGSTSVKKFAVLNSGNHVVFEEAYDIFDTADESKLAGNGFNKLVLMCKVPGSEHHYYRVLEKPLVKPESVDEDIKPQEAALPYDPKYVEDASSDSWLVDSLDDPDTRWDVVIHSSEDGRRSIIVGSHDFYTCYSLFTAYVGRGDIESITLGGYNSHGYIRLRRWLHENIVDEDLTPVAQEIYYDHNYLIPDNGIFKPDNDDEYHLVHYPVRIGNDTYTISEVISNFAEDDAWKVGSHDSSNLGNGGLYSSRSNGHEEMSFEEAYDLFINFENKYRGREDEYVTVMFIHENYCYPVLVRECDWEEPVIEDLTLEPADDKMIHYTQEIVDSHVVDDNNVAEWFTIGTKDAKTLFMKHHDEILEGRIFGVDSNWEQVSDEDILNGQWLYLAHWPRRDDSILSGLDYTLIIELERGGIAIRDESHNILDSLYQLDYVDVQRPAIVSEDIKPAAAQDVTIHTYYPADENENRPQPFDCYKLSEAVKNELWNRFSDVIHAANLTLDNISDDDILDFTWYYFPLMFGGSLLITDNNFAGASIIVTNLLEQHPDLVDTIMNSQIVDGNINEDLQLEPVSRLHDYDENYLALAVYNGLGSDYDRASKEIVDNFIQIYGQDNIWHLCLADNSGKVLTQYDFADNKYNERCTFDEAYKLFKEYTWNRNDAHKKPLVKLRLAFTYNDAWGDEASLAADLGLDDIANKYNIKYKNLIWTPEHRLDHDDYILVREINKSDMHEDLQPQSSNFTVYSAMDHIDIREWFARQRAGDEFTILAVDPDGNTFAVHNDYSLAAVTDAGAPALPEDEVDILTSFLLDDCVTILPKGRADNSLWYSVNTYDVFLPSFGESITSAQIDTLYRYIDVLERFEAKIVNSHPGCPLNQFIIQCINTRDTQSHQSIRLRDFDINRDSIDDPVQIEVDEDLQPRELSRGHYYNSEYATFNPDEEITIYSNEHNDEVQMTLKEIIDVYGNEPIWSVVSYSNRYDSGGKIILKEATFDEAWDTFETYNFDNSDRDYCTIDVPDCPSSPRGANWVLFIRYKPGAQHEDLKLHQEDIPDYKNNPWIHINYGGPCDPEKAIADHHLDEVWCLDEELSINVSYKGFANELPEGYNGFFTFKEAYKKFLEFKNIHDREVILHLCCKTPTDDGYEGIWSILYRYIEGRTVAENLDLNATDDFNVENATAMGTERFRIDSESLKKKLLDAFGFRGDSADYLVFMEGDEFNIYKERNDSPGLYRHYGVAFCSDEFKNDILNNTVDDNIDSYYPTWNMHEDLDLQVVDMPEFSKENVHKIGAKLVGTWVSGHTEDSAVEFILDHMDDPNWDLSRWNDELAFLGMNDEITFAEAWSELVEHAADPLYFELRYSGEGLHNDALIILDNRPSSLPEDIELQQQPEDNVCYYHCPSSRGYLPYWLIPEENIALKEKFLTLLKEIAERNGNNIEYNNYRPMTAEDIEAIKNDDTTMFKEWGIYNITGGDREHTPGLKVWAWNLEKDEGEDAYTQTETVILFVFINKEVDTIIKFLDQNTTERFDEDLRPKQEEPLKFRTDGWFLGPSDEARQITRNEYIERYKDERVWCLYVEMKDENRGPYFLYNSSPFDTIFREFQRYSNKDAKRVSIMLKKHGDPLIITRDLTEGIEEDLQQPEFSHAEVHENNRDADVFLRISDKEYVDFCKIAEKNFDEYATNPEAHFDFWLYIDGDMYGNLGYNLVSSAAGKYIWSMHIRPDLTIDDPEEKEYNDKAIEKGLAIDKLFGMGVCQRFLDHRKNVTEDIQANPAIRNTDDENREIFHQFLEDNLPGTPGDVREWNNMLFIGFDNTTLDTGFEFVDGEVVYLYIHDPEGDSGDRFWQALVNNDEQTLSELSPDLDVANTLPVKEMMYYVGAQWGISNGDVDDWIREKNIPVTD